MRSLWIGFHWFKVVGGVWEVCQCGVSGGWLCEVEVQPTRGWVGLGCEAAA